MKTNVMRILDAHKINYSYFEYAQDSSLTGEDIASILKEDPKKVFKTLITQGKSKTYYAFLVPVNKELDLKKASEIVNEKNLEMIPLKDLLKVSGYVHGGCSPIGLKKDYQVTIDESAKNYEEIYFSGGHLGVQVKVKIADLINLIHPKFGNIIK